MVRAAVTVTPRFHAAATPGSSRGELIPRWRSSRSRQNRPARAKAGGGRPCRLAVEVPYGFVGAGEVAGEEAAAVDAGEDAGVAPALPGDRSGLLGHGPRSRMSTTSRSPGAAPSTAIGPLSG